MQQTKTLAEIEARLAEIATEQDAHAARDFDAELADALAQGGDVDALEAQHLDAERIARRLRVERQALEAALPAARLEHAKRELAPLKKEHGKAAKAAVAAATKASAAWQELQAAVAELEEAREQARVVVSKERALLTKMKATETTTERLGIPVAPEMQNIAGGMLGLSHRAAELGRLHPGLITPGFQTHHIEVEGKQ